MKAKTKLKKAKRRPPKTVVRKSRKSRQKANKLRGAEKPKPRPVRPVEMTPPPDVPQASESMAAESDNSRVAAGLEPLGSDDSSPDEVIEDVAAQAEEEVADDEELSDELVVEPEEAANARD